MVMRTGLPEKIVSPQIALQEILYQSAKKFPRKTALICGDREITYAELDALSNQFANGLASLGVKKGDRVAVFLPNIPEFVIAYFGILKSGAVVTAISPLHREREVEYQLLDSGAQTIVASDSLFPVVEHVWAKTKLRNVIVTGSAASEASFPDKPNVWGFGQLTEQPRQLIIKLRLIRGRIWRFCSTRAAPREQPKGAMLTHSNLLANALAFAAWIGGKPAQETFLTALPLFHIYGMTTSMTVPISLASKMVLMPRFESANALDAIERHRVTVFCGVPTMYQALLASPELSKHDLRSIRVCISGASPLPPNVQKRFMQVTGGLLAEGYGLTEASPVTHCNPVDRTLRTVRVGSIGLPTARHRSANNRFGNR